MTYIFSEDHGVDATDACEELFMINDIHVSISWQTVFDQISKHPEESWMYDE